MGLKDWADKQAAIANTQGTFEGVTLGASSITHKGTMHRVAGAMARVESGADIERRVTATRLITTGVFAFAIKKQKGHVFLTVEHPDFEFVVEVAAKKEAQARQFASKINRAAKPK